MTSPFPMKPAARTCLWLKSILSLIALCAPLLGTTPPSVSLAAHSIGVFPDLSLPCFAGLAQKVSFELRDADVVTVFDVMARESNVNLVVSPAVRGQITIRLENVSRWEALHHMVESLHLLMKEERCVLRIYTAADILKTSEILDATLRQQELEAKQREKEAEIRDKEAQARRRLAEAERAERAAAPLVTRSVPIRFVSGKKLAEDLQKLLTPPLTTVPGASPTGARTFTQIPIALEGGLLLQPEQPFVTFNADANSIIIRDREERVNELVRLIRELDRETRQVLIEAKIMETTRNFTRDLGIQWGFLSRGVTDRRFPATWGIQGGHIHNDGSAPFLSPPLSGAGNWVVNFPFLPSDTGAALAMTFANVANTFALDIQISAAEQNNDIRILSNPRILTLDHQQATIESGEEVPFQTVENENVKIEFKKAVILLQVTPHIVADDMIKLEVRVKKDEVDTLRTVGGNPFFLTKEAATIILMKNGDTLIIGGLSKDRQGRVDSGVPWLSRIPVLKHLFGRTRNTKDYEEVMVFITPQLAPRMGSGSSE